MIAEVQIAAVKRAVEPHPTVYSVRMILQTLRSLKRFPAVGHFADKSALHIMQIKVKLNNGYSPNKDLIMLHAYAKTTKNTNSLRVKCRYNL